MNNPPFLFLLLINLAANFVVFLLGVVAVLDEFAQIGQKGDEALVLALAIAIYSAPLWAGLVVLGVVQRKSLSTVEKVLSPVPMLVMISFVIAVFLALVLTGPLC